MKIQDIWQMHEKEPLISVIDGSDSPMYYCPSCGAYNDYLSFHCEGCNYEFPLGNEKFYESPDELVPMLRRPVWSELRPDFSYVEIDLTKLIGKASSFEHKNLDFYLSQTSMDDFLGQNIKK